jgi:hypothetical protein
MNWLISPDPLPAGCHLDEFQAEFEAVFGGVVTRCQVLQTLVETKVCNGDKCDFCHDLKMRKSPYLLSWHRVTAKMAPERGAKWKG